MKRFLQQLLDDALAELRRTGVLAPSHAGPCTVERTRDRRHGDFASNVALTLAKEAGLAPRELAQHIVAMLADDVRLAQVAVAGPGFINFTLSPTAFQSVVPAILDAGEDYGRSGRGAGQAVQVEFVSANPTGPLHVGHGRGAAYGAAVADLLEAVGFRVHREYYVNDAGRQMDILAASVWLRYLELCGEKIVFPANGYQGDYVWDIAANLHRGHADAFHAPGARVYADLPPDEPDGGDRETYVDALIARARELLGAQRYRIVFDAGLVAILADIRRDLEEFGVLYQEWFSERSLVEDGAVTRAIERLGAGGHTYERDGALWFRSSALGDTKDRVLVRENGQTTYFASDVAYHMNKRERGFERLIDVWGADHHGYVARVKAALGALGENPACLDVLLVQFAILYRDGEKVRMSTRSGEFITLRELRREVGNDAARFFYVMRKCEQHLDFDLDLAKSESADNPVYYIQYAHARVCSVLKQRVEKGLERDEARGNANLDRLTENHEQALLYTLSRYPEVVEAAAHGKEPHLLAHYLRELANDFHTYYNAHPFLVEDAGLRDVRLNLIVAVRQVLRNGLRLLGVSAPETM